MTSGTRERAKWLDERPSEAVRQAWVDLLNRLGPWTWFATLTFRGNPHPEAALKRVGVFLKRLNKDLYGPACTYLRTGVRAIVALERTRKNVVHCHLLVGGLGLEEIRRLDWKDKWEELAGFARIESPRSRDAVASYCSKYVVKGGEIELILPEREPWPGLLRRGQPETYSRKKNPRRGYALARQDDRADVRGTATE